MKTSVKYYITTLFAVLTMMVPLSSCVDDVPYSSSVIPDGHSEVSFDLDFKAFIPALHSRTTGDVIKGIESLWIVIYNEDGDLVISRPVTDADGLTTSLQERPGFGSSESETGHAEFKLTLTNGRYQIYAIANTDLNGADITTPEKLMAFRTRWYVNDIKNNGEMLGRFTIQDGTTAPPVSDITDLSDPFIEIKGNTRLHAWLRRSASKVTVAYDGSNLVDGVEIYLMSVSIKDIPMTCPLGDTNTPTTTDSLFHDGETIYYYTGDGTTLDFDNYEAKITNINGNGKTTFGSDHTDSADALFFYENMQGVHTDVNKTQKDDNGDGIPDNQDRVKDAVPYGTYIEVEGYYRSTNHNTNRPNDSTNPDGNAPSKTTEGVIKYRFMLGKDTKNDFDAERNHHYKLTLKFNYHANDYDWHVDYEENYLSVSSPRVFDYRGMVFVPNPDVENLDHTFSYDNSVIVSSFYENHTGTYVVPTLSYAEGDSENFTATPPAWLSHQVSNATLPYQRTFTFRASGGPGRVNNDAGSDVKSFNINARLKAATPKGTEDTPFNLANPKQGAVAPASATIDETANCYIVDAPGWYMFPLVYGNAIKNGQPNTSAYTPGGNGLSTFLNHLGKPISSPYIKQNSGCETPQRADLILQDVQNLIYYLAWPAAEWSNWNIDSDHPYGKNMDVQYIPDAYGSSIGGIKFQIRKDNIKQGNVTIALSDSKFTAGQLIPSAKTPVMWSWHIWVTNMFGNDAVYDSDRNIEVTTHDNEVLKLLPMNLGWCSTDEDELRYYPERKCKVMFTAGKKTETIEIIQKSHISLTCGDNPYYQWGRKDPFLGVDQSGSNKKRYFNFDKGNLNSDEYNEKWSFATDNYYTIYPTGEGKNTTDDGTVADRIKYPYLWHNPPRISPGYHGNPFQSTNTTYSNLWGAQSDPDVETIKTVYDPCPPGYKVPGRNAFTGFTTSGFNTGELSSLYDARVENNGDYNYPEIGACNQYVERIFEFYTNPDKVQSILFPMNGYRDWDSTAAYADWLPGYIYYGGHMYDWGNKGYSWSAIECTDVNIFDSTVYRNINDWIFHLDFSRFGGLGYFIRPQDVFFSCDGFPVRPVKEEN